MSSPRTSSDAVEVDDGVKAHVHNVEVAGLAANADTPNPKKEAPAYVASLSPEERAAAEKALVRKIDIRLLPVTVIMYILNYLDRNNIVRVPSSSCIDSFADFSYLGRGSSGWSSARSGTRGQSVCGKSSINLFLS